MLGRLTRKKVLPAAGTRARAASSSSCPGLAATDQFAGHKRGKLEDGSQYDPGTAKMIDADHDATPGSQQTLQTESKT